MDDKIFREKLWLKNLPPFEELGSRPCRICGKPNDHEHFRWDEKLQRNMIVPEPDE